MTSSCEELATHVVTGSAVKDLVLDGGKVQWYRDRVEAWARGERIAPITMDIAWTRKCNAACSFCYASLQSSVGVDEDGRQKQITKKIAFEFLEDAAAIGVKGISLISDGESTVVPWYAESIEYAAKLGIKIGIGTNGVRLKRKLLERILPHTSYLRFNFSAGEPDRYSDIMGLPVRDYYQVIQNVKDAMEIVRRDNLPCSVNMQMVTRPQDHDQIIPLARLAKEISPSYLIYKHCATDSLNGLEIDYREYDKCFPLFREAEAMGDDEFRIVVKWSRLADEGKRQYSRCLAPPFQLQMSGNGLISSCGFHFNERYKKFHMGNVVTTRFSEIFQSDRYWDIVRYLASDEFDARERCGENCLQTSNNKWLYDWQEGKVDFPSGSPPPDLAFL